MRPPPDPSRPSVKSFLGTIVKDTSPYYVPVQPAPFAEVNDCFGAVPKQVELHGGHQQIGWTIWMWPKVLVEAEFHSIWISPEGQPIDITPKGAEIPRILFCPDNHRQYRGCQINNIRKPLQNRREIKRFCELATLIHKELNKGDLAFYHGTIELSDQCRRYRAEQAELQLWLWRKYGRTEPEPRAST